MPQIPTAAWLAQYEKVKDLLTPSVPYGEIFGQSEAYGQKLHYLAMGEVNFPTGKIMAFDPVAYPEQMRPYLQSVPPGKYPITAMVVEIGADCRCLLQRFERARRPKRHKKRRVLWLLRRCRAGNHHG